MKDSLIFVEKNFEKWNWDIISELLDGPLLNGKRFEEAINAKFLKRLMNFFLPYSKQFSEAKKVKAFPFFIFFFVLFRANHLLFFFLFSFFFSFSKGLQMSEMYARVGCQLIQTCLAHNEGLKFLAESELISQVP